MHRLRTFRITAGLLLALAACRPATAQTLSPSVTEHVIVDTSSNQVQGIDGILFFQFNPFPGGGSAFAKATVSNFQGDGTFDSSPPVTSGDATVAPGSLTLDNGTALNYVSQGYTFATNLSFDVTLSGPALLSSSSATAGSSFALSLLDSAGDILLTTDPNGSVVTLNVDTNGNVTSQTFPTPSGGPPAATVILEANPTPEPCSLLLFAAVLPAGIVIARRRGDRATLRT